MSDTEKKHGGARAGAGRKTKYEKTTVMRVPEKYKDAISALISHLDETKHINKHYPQGSQSDPVFLRSLDDNAQNIVFTTKPI
ncbi:hypothetical protein PY479_17365 [Shewanella sp. A32]|uniref:hypothetical protein n=1 Tax=Shewanella sp. A32 TaxID=3031327 RepID=UPI0023B97CC3|nr:hypothetical protein [Shewanella sp. A32]MDF0536030.1 hypothetical protein [Shewanella sp. A32]